MMANRDQFSRYRNQHEFKNYKKTHSYEQSVERVTNNRNSSTGLEVRHNDKRVSKSYQHSRYSPERTDRRLVREKNSGYEHTYFDNQFSGKFKLKDRRNHDDWFYEENLHNKREITRREEFFSNNRGIVSDNSDKNRSYSLQQSDDYDKKIINNFEGSRFKKPTKNCNDDSASWRFQISDDSWFNSKETNKYKECLPNHTGGHSNDIEQFNSVEIKNSCNIIYGPGCVENSIHYQEKCFIRSPDNNSKHISYEEKEWSRLKSDGKEKTCPSTENQWDKKYLSEHHTDVFRCSDEHIYERRVIYKPHSDLDYPTKLIEPMTSDKSCSSVQPATVSEVLTKFTRNNQDSILDNSKLITNLKYETDDGHPFDSRSNVNDFRDNLHERMANDNKRKQEYKFDWNGCQNYVENYATEQRAQCFQDSFLDNSNKITNLKYETYDSHPCKTRSDVDNFRDNLNERMTNDNKRTCTRSLQGSKFDWNDCQNGVENCKIEQRVQCYKEESDEGEEVTFLKVNPVIPDWATVNRFKLYPPSAVEMEEIFKGMVVYFRFKLNSTPDELAMYSITDSFKESAHFDNLQVHDAYHDKYPHLKYSTIRWHGMILARGISEMVKSNSSRNIAAMELINKLTQRCYSLKEKPEYFHSNSIQKLLEFKEIPGISRLVSYEEAPNLEEIIRYIENFFKDNNDYELGFHCDMNMLLDLKRYVQSKGYRLRSNKPYVFISLRRTPQYWRDKILARGRLEDYRYQLIPPQGLGYNLFPNCNMKLLEQAKQKESKVHPLLLESLHAKRYGPEIENNLVPLDQVTHGFRMQQEQDKNEQALKKLQDRERKIAKRKAKREAKKQMRQSKVQNQKVMKMQTQKPIKELFQAHGQNQKSIEGLMQSQTWTQNQAPAIKKPPQPKKAHLPPGVKKPKFKNKTEYNRMARKYYQINRAMRRGKSLAQTKTYKNMDEETQKWVMCRYSAVNNRTVLKKEESV